MFNHVTFMDFSYHAIGAINAPVALRVGRLEGWRMLIGQDQDLAPASAGFHITATLRSHGTVLALPQRTPFRPFSDGHVAWDAWLVFAGKYRDLSRDASILLSVFCAPNAATPVAISHLPLFTSQHKLRRGRQRLFLFAPDTPAAEIDGKHPPHDPDPEATRLYKLEKKYANGEMPKSEWLDPLALAVIRDARESSPSAGGAAWLHIELQSFDFPVVHTEPVLTPPVYRRIYTYDNFDPDVFWDVDNVVESKHRNLVRHTHRSHSHDSEHLKPTTRIRSLLNTVLAFPPARLLSSTEADTVYKYRWYLASDPAALIWFLKSVVWDDEIERRQAVKLLAAWSTGNVECVLEMLGGASVAFTAEQDWWAREEVRAYAVGRLAQASDEDLMLYLLQLVQALRFEPSASGNSTGSSATSQVLSLDDDSAEESHASAIITPETSSRRLSLTPLQELLVSRAVANTAFGNYFFWYTSIECQNEHISAIYRPVLAEFCARLASQGTFNRKVLKRQVKLLAALGELAEEIKASKETRPKKIARLRAKITSPDSGLAGFDPMPLPLDPSVLVNGIVTSKTSVFKSQLRPMLITFSQAPTAADPAPADYPTIFKSGDDLRQDQLVVQLITLMDIILKRENLDLKLTPYRVLATGPLLGLVQFIPSHALADVLATYDQGLLGFFRKHHGDAEATATYGVKPSVMDTYVKSCAGYCVITYLLGVGDRHLDNLLITTDGALFHVDFGYIFGRDPKPFPPPMKISREMIDAMGGLGSPHYARFRTLSFVAFSTLRRHASVILSMLSLMVQSGIPDIALEPDKAVLNVQVKFRLDVPEEAALMDFQGLINDSVSALFPAMMETIHKWAQYWRK